jgi:hypothetical protein
MSDARKHLSSCSETSRRGSRRVWHGPAEDKLIDTSAPSARARRAVSSPMPELPPITTTVCPGSSGSRLMAGVVVTIPPVGLARATG